MTRKRSCHCVCSINFHEPDTGVSPGPGSRASLPPEARLTALPSHHPTGSPSPSAFVISWERLAAQPRASRCWPLGPPAPLLCSLPPGTGRRPVRACTGRCERPCPSPAPCLRCAFLSGLVCVSLFPEPRPPAFRDRCSLLSAPRTCCSQQEFLLHPSPASSLLTLPWLPSTPGLNTAPSSSAPMGPLIVCHPLPGSSLQASVRPHRPCPSLPSTHPGLGRGRLSPQPLRPLAVAWTLD